MFEKVAFIKRFEYLPLGSGLKKQTDTARKQFQKLDKVYEFNKNEDGEKVKKVYI